MTGFVYLLQAECGRVKIGHSADPLTRYQLFCLYASEPTRLVAMWPAERAEERSLHEKFAHLRSYREWFHLGEDLAAFVASKDGLGLVQLPEWVAELALSDTDRKAARYRRSGLKNRGPRKPSP